jgi:hypothetical protein
MIVNGINLTVIEWRITLLERAALGRELPKPRTMLVLGYMASSAVFVLAAMALASH